MGRDDGRTRVRQLSERFAANLDYYRSQSFDEESTKQLFVTPFFESLGWDVTDQAGLGPRREVILESRLEGQVSLAGEDAWDQDLTPEELAERQPRLRFPDYGFRSDLRYLFFAEAKKPSVDVLGRGPAFQVKSYAWSEQLPISCVTSFDRLVAFDCTQRPAYDDPKGGWSSDQSFVFTEYADRWDEVWNLFSREAVAAGSLDVFIRGRARRRGAVAVDRSFLDDLAQWRARLAEDLERRNPTLDKYELAEATQRILDRVVFIRVCEDRLIEPGQLLRRYARMPDAYHRLVQEFRRLDVVYNGQLFGEHFSERLELTNDLFQRLIESLYPPVSPYRFDVIGADLLGAVYERFLGQTIELSESGEVTLEDKPEVRHAGGVYYTPRWVVDRIVRSAVGPHLEGRTPRTARRVRILDPACGSGSFLLGALDFLISWHESYYTSHPGEERGRHVTAADGTERLTSDAKAELLTNCIHGIDIDPQAVEVTQMSLYLKILEGETSDLRLFHSGALLPSLDRNIRCGNTLLGIHDVPGPSLIEEDLNRRINPFDWESDRDGFGSIIGVGGFHAIIGNPPYTRIQVLRSYRAEEADAYSHKYVSASEGSYDIAGLFVERCLPYLNRSSRQPGRLAFIISRTFAEADFGRPLRELLSSKRGVAEVIDFGSGIVFEGVGAYTLLVVVVAKEQADYHLVRVPPPPSPAAVAWAEDEDNGVSAVMPASSLGSKEWDFLLPAEAAFLDRLASAHPTLSDLSGGVMFQGVTTGADNTVFRFIDQGPDPKNGDLRLVCSRGSPNDPPIRIESALLRPVYEGRGAIVRFLTRPTTEYLLLPYERSSADERYALIPRTKMETVYSHAWKWLQQHEQLLRQRRGVTWTDTNWHAYSARKNLELFEQDKLLVPYMVEDLCAHWDVERHFFVNVAAGGYGVPVVEGWDPVYVEAVLSSRLLSWVLRRRSRAWRGGWFAARKRNLERLPIADSDARIRELIVALYRTCASRRASLERGVSDAARERAGRLYRSSVEEFDAAVEELYDVTDAERRLIVQP